MAKIKIYRGIGARTKEELEKYIKDFYNRDSIFITHGGGRNLGEGSYFTTSRKEAEAYANDYEYSHIFELEVDTDDFLDIETVNKTDVLDQYDYFKEVKNRIEKLKAQRYFDYEYYEELQRELINAQDKALLEYVKDNNKLGVFQKGDSGGTFVLHSKKILDKTPVERKLKTPNYWDKRALKRLSDSEKMSEEYIKRIKKIYDKAYKDIDEEIKNVYKNYAKDTGLDVQKLKELLTRSETKKTWEQMKRQGLDKYIKNNYKARISRLEQIQAQIYAKAKLIYPKEELEQTMAYKGVINDSYYKAVYDTQMGTGYDFAFTKIDNNMMTALLNERWSGLNYSQRIWGNTDILAESLSEVIGAGMMSGKSISKMSKEIKERFKVSKYYAERLVRTEVNHFNNTADAMAYEDMGIEMYVFVATLDSRTSEICQNMDGKKFKYSEKEEGVNYPPLHPNCRSKTRGYVDEETEKSLQRRARNPVTGKSEIVSNMSYKEWAKKNGLFDEKNKKIVKIDKKPAKNSKKSTKTSKKAIDIYDLPSNWTNTKAKQDHAKVLVDYLNNCKSDNKVAELYKSMGKIKNINKVDINYVDKSHALILKDSLYNGVTDVKVKVPKLSGLKNPAGAVNTTLHENMHVIDFALKGTDNSVFMSGNSLDFRQAIIDDDGSVGDKVKSLFKEYNEKSKSIYNDIYEKNKHKFSELTDRYQNKEITYKTYTGYWNKLKNEIKSLADYDERNYMNGVDNLQDIYDALSGGKLRDSGVVRYGHGTKYFRKSKLNSQAKEILADYGTLKMTRQDLVELLKEDKPQLVAELDKLIDEMLKEVNK